MTIDKAKLRALAEHVIKELEIGFANAATAAFHKAANPATILALLGEIERFERKNANQSETIRQYQDHLLGGDSILSLTNENEKFDEGMRALACQLGAGGYNAETLTAEQLVAKVADGLASFAESSGRLLDGVRAENEALRSQVAKLQAEPNSYQSGFDAGRAAEKAHAENWRAEAEGLRKDAARLTWLDESQEVDSVGPTLCCGKHRPTLREAIDAAMAMEARHD